MRVIDYVEAERLHDWVESSSSEAWSVSYQKHVEEARQRAISQMQAMRQELPQPFQSDAPIVAKGHIAEQILSTIESHSIDLVVVGALWFVLVSGVAKGLADFRRELIFHRPGDPAAEPILHDVHHQVGD